MHVLLIEPNYLLAMTYRTALINAGYEVAHAVSAQTAIRSIDQNVPQLIVLELQLAGHSGIEFLYELRSYPEWQSIPVMVHSLVDLTRHEQSQERLQNIGVSTYLYKPVTTLRHFVQTVREHMSSRAIA